MGRHGPRGEFVVEHMIGPGANADHRRASFAPDADWQWAEMRRLHEAHGGDLAFLGDWHTHPRSSSGALSRMDLRAVGEILHDPQTRARSIISVVFAGGRIVWVPRAWVATHATDGAEESVVISRGVIVDDR